LYFFVLIFNDFTPMRGQDNYEKLKAAGFRILRSDDYPAPRIKEWVSDGAWRTVENFPTKAARDRRLQEMLNDPKIVTL